MSERTATNTFRLQLVRWWGWLVVSTLAFACLIAVRYFAVADLEYSGPLLLFRLAMLISHFALLSTVLMSPVLLVILLLPRHSLAIPLGVLCSALVLCALLIDTQVFHLYRFHINAGVINLLFGGAALETFVFPRAMYLQAAFIFSSVVALIGALSFAAWRYVRHRQGTKASRSVLVAICLCTVAFHAVHVWADAVAVDAIVEQTEVLPLGYAATAKRMLRRMGVDVRSGSTMRAARDEGGGGLAYPLRPLACAAQEKPPNLVFIVVDSWRFDALGPKVTPNVHAFANRTVEFQNHFSGGNATRIGVFSLFYSIPGTYWHRILDEQQRPVFIEELIRREYELGVFRSAPLYSPEFDRTIFAGVQGVRMRSQGKRPWQWDRDLTDDFKQFMENRAGEEPFFAFLFYDSPHSFDMPRDYPVPFQPNGPRVNYLDLHGIEDPEPFINRYLNSVHYVDSLIGEALATLEASGSLENSVIVITGDHGQEFNDSGREFWGHGSNFTRYQTGVPMLLYAPDQEPRKYAHRTSHFDVVPTLLERYLGCTSSMSDYSVGKSLFVPGGRETLLMSEYADFAIVQPDRIAVVRKQGMDILNAEYVELEGATLAPDVVAQALEQKRRFYGMKPLQGE